MYVGKYNTLEAIFGDLEDFFKELNSDLLERSDQAVAEILFETPAEAARAYRETLYSRTSFSTQTKAALSIASRPAEVDFLPQTVFYEAEEKQSHSSSVKHNNALSSSKKHDSASPSQELLRTCLKSF